MDKTRPIGLFDSGFGGLTVMKEIARHLPSEHLVYFGDTAHLPYGNKSPQAVLEYALNNASFLLKQNIKLLIIPCHTACCHALETLKSKLPIPVVGVTEPGIELLKQSTRSWRIAILGTTSTIQSGIYQSLILQQNQKATLFPTACPLFVPLVEEGLFDHPSAHLIAEHYLAFLKDKQIDSALLACTHYPLLKTTIQDVLGPAVKLIEPAEICAIQTREILLRSNLLNVAAQAPRYQFFASDDPDKFKRFAPLFFGSEIDSVERISIL
ncbi:MAG: glutamate racemase [Chlamydiae bacterium RIFCSPHIGHO2_12_FULL_49_9]|nr:MAG: glutamate racemase [Chlamydiae bacterium RIFCSPHIGHO2_12_FULL_49_9]